MWDHLTDGFLFSGFSPDRLSLSREAADYVSRTTVRVGYDSDNVSQPIREKIRAAIQTGLDAVSLAGIGRMTAIDAWDEEKITGREIVVFSPHWARVVSRMAAPRAMVCFVLTLGEAFDRVRERMELFEAYVLDGFGSELIEQAAARVEDNIVGWAQKNAMACSRRFSPGYCDWPLAAGQKGMFAFLDPAVIGVKALPSGAMLPSKSVSAVIITADQVPLAWPCPFCRNMTCDHRRA
ncbi:MAG: hypothetical protein AB1724_06020 [Thermodesulfobacteriota bacterium]